MEVAPGAIAAGCAAALGVLAIRRAQLPTVPWAHPEREALADVGWAYPLAYWEALRATTAAVLTLATFVLGLPLPALFLLVIGAALPSMVLRVRLDGARQKSRASTVRLVRAIHAGLLSGAALPEALARAVASCPDKLAARPFGEALRAFAVGSSLDDALRAAAATSDRRARVALETLALGVGERLSVQRLATLAEEACDRLAFDERLDAEVRARTSGVRTQVWVLALAVPALAAYLFATVPTLAGTFDTPLGRNLLIPGAVLLELSGLVLTRRIVRGVLR